MNDSVIFASLLAILCQASNGPCVAGGVPLPGSDPFFVQPVRGFVSEAPAADWQQGILTGNGTIGAIVMGNPFDETLYLSHASLFLPNSQNPHTLTMASRLESIRKLCLAGDYIAANHQVVEAINECKSGIARDPFIGAFTLRIKQPEDKASRYRRSVDFMTAETAVSVEGTQGSFRRSAFASRADDLLVLRLVGSGNQTAEFSFAGLPPANEREANIIKNGIKSTEQGTRDGFLYFRNLFANTNDYNLNIGYEGVGKVISIGGQRSETATGIGITGAKEVLVLVKIRPLLKKVGTASNAPAMEQELNALPPDYGALLARQAKVQGDLMGRVGFSLGVPSAERAKTSEQLNKESENQEAPLAKVERAFDAGRYNILCCTGFFPPNLQGLWSGTWLAPWSGSFTTNGNLQCATSFLLMGNTPELMQSLFRYYDERWPGFRDNAKELFGTRGFHIPAQLTISPKETNQTIHNPHSYWHSGAAWACQPYYDYYLHTGDRKFLAERAYPLLKETAAFYEDFLTVTDSKGKLVFVPDYSPENSPSGKDRCPTTINATMDIAAAKQLLRNAIASAKLLGCDADLQAKWTQLIARLPDYEVGPDGSFREWLWPDLEENNQQRHASHLYGLYDEMPAEITENPNLVKAVEHTIRQRLDFQRKNPVMAFGIVQLGLAAEHIGESEQTQEIINFLAKGYWSSGMASFHDKGNLFNMDLSGGFPYLCASALVYADPGRIRFFPARPAQWRTGSLSGVRLRGGILLRKLTWEGDKATATLVADHDQTVVIEWPNGKPKSMALRAGVQTVLGSESP